jgi:hypothetical protein
LQLTCLLLYDKIVRKILFFIFIFSLFLLPAVKTYAATCTVTPATITSSTAPRISLVIKGSAITKGDYFVTLTNTTGPLLKDGTTTRTIGSASITNWNNNRMTAQTDGELDTASFDGSADIGSNDPYNVGTYTAAVHAWDSSILICTGAFQILPNSGSSGSSTVSIPNGSYGCSFKLPPTGTTTVSSADMLIPCQSGGICVAGDKYNIQVVSGVPELTNGLCESTGNQCPICDPGYEYSNQGQNCVNASDPLKQKSFAKVTSCQADQGCSPGIGCVGAGTTDQSQPLSLCQNGISCPTALGDLPTNLSALLTKVFSIALSIAGVVALGLIIVSGYRLMISQGNPEQVKGAREQLTAAIIGLLFIIFSLVILQIIGVNILKIPGFG